VVEESVYRIRHVGAVPIAEKIEKYSVYVTQNDLLSYTRLIKLLLESGETAYIGFPVERPDDWLQFVEGGRKINLYMTADQFTDVYHVLQTETPAYFTALNLVGFRVGAVHSELDLEHVPAAEVGNIESLEGLIQLASKQPSS
jgi:hypothetical protein